MADFDPSSVDTVAEYYERDLQQCRDTLDRLYQFHEEYVGLRKTVEELPNRLTHNIMVPLGPKAFMPGVIRHTNELTVLLGADYYVDVTNRHALGIIDRRLESVEKDITSKQELLQETSIQLARAYNWFGNDSINDDTLDKSKIVNVLYAKNSNISSTKSAIQGKTVTPIQIKKHVEEDLNREEVVSAENATNITSTTTTPATTPATTQLYKSKANTPKSMTSASTSKVPKGNIIETVLGEDDTLLPPSSFDPNVQSKPKFSTGMPELNSFSIFRKGLTEEGEDMFEIIEHIDDDTDDLEPTRFLAPSTQAPPAYSLEISEASATATEIVNQYSTVVGNHTIEEGVEENEEEEEEEEEEILETGGGYIAPTTTTTTTTAKVAANYPAILTPGDILQSRRKTGAENESEIEKAFWDGFQDQLDLTTGRDSLQDIDDIYNAAVNNTQQEKSITKPKESKDRSIQWNSTIEESVSFEKGDSPSSISTTKPKKVEDIILLDTEKPNMSTTTTTAELENNIMADTNVDAAGAGADSSNTATYSTESFNAFWSKLEVLSKEDRESGKQPQPSTNILDALALLDEEDDEAYFNSMYSMGLFDDEDMEDIEEDSYFEEEFADSNTLAIQKSIYEMEKQKNKQTQQQQQGQGQNIKNNTVEEDKPYEFGFTVDQNANILKRHAMKLPPRQQAIPQAEAEAAAAAKKQEVQEPEIPAPKVEDAFTGTIVFKDAKRPPKVKVDEANVTTTTTAATTSAVTTEIPTIISPDENATASVVVEKERKSLFASRRKEQKTQTHDSTNTVDETPTKPMSRFKAARMNM